MIENNIPFSIAAGGRPIPVCKGSGSPVRRRRKGPERYSSAGTKRQIYTTGGCISTGHLPRIIRFGARHSSVSRMPLGKSIGRRMTWYGRGFGGFGGGGSRRRKTTLPLLTRLIRVASSTASACRLASDKCTAARPRAFARPRLPPCFRSSRVIALLCQRHLLMQMRKKRLRGRTPWCRDGECG